MTRRKTKKEDLSVANWSSTTAAEIPLKARAAGLQFADSSANYRRQIQEVVGVFLNLLTYGLWFFSTFSSLLTDFSECVLSMEGWKEEVQTAVRNQRVMVLALIWLVKHFGRSRIGIFFYVYLYKMEIPMTIILFFEIVCELLVWIALGCWK